MIPSNKGEKAVEWISCIRKTIDLIENSLEEDVSVDAICAQVYLSPVLLQKGFSVMTGYSVGEYLRNRRLYQAAVDLQTTDEKVIDIALKYGYETPESFTKAFTRFHSVTPSQARGGAAIRVFLRLNINIDVLGGGKMKVKIVKMFPFKVIGFAKVFDCETSFKEVPAFWDAICEKYAANVYAGNPPANPYEKAIMDYCIGEYAICVDDGYGEGKMLYILGGKYTGGDVPDGMVVYELPHTEWAVFDCIGPMPKAIQEMTTRIYKEWLPGNPDYELDGSAMVEWYDCLNGETSDPDYHSAVWIPVKRKEK